MFEHNGKIFYRLDATRMHPDLALYQGAIPLYGTALFHAGFNVVVLCAEEHQPLRSEFENIEVIHAPMMDLGDVLFSKDAKRAESVSDMVVGELKNGKRVLVTCISGDNRSSLITGLVLSKMLGIRGKDILVAIRNSKRHALSNIGFARYLSNTL